MVRTPHLPEDVTRPTTRWCLVALAAALCLVPVAAAWVSSTDTAVAADRLAQQEEPASPDAVPAGTEVTVVTKNIEPFIFGDAGEPTGFSADVWNEISRRNGWITEWVWTEEVSDQIQQVLDGEVDASIAAISMTPERELQVDFSHRMFSSGLQIMSRPGDASVWDAFRSTVFTPQLFSAFAVVVVIILVVGHIVWLAMRKREDFPKGYIRGVGQGMWLIGNSLFVSSRIAVVFFQGSEPSRVVSRILVIVWMAIAVVLVSYVNGTITATLTVSEIRNNVTSPSDLPGVRVTTVDNTQAAIWLRGEGIDFEPVVDVDAGIERLESGLSDAFVFDSPVLRWERSQRPGTGLEVGAELFDPVPYGIALQPDSPLREQVNASLLEMLTDGTYDRLLAPYGG